MINKIVKSGMPSSAVLDRLQRTRKQIRNFRYLARDYGQWLTIRDWNSVDEAGNPIPWYTYPTTEYLSHLDLSQMVVFEYGSGNSTLWWAKRSKRVVSVEDDKKSGLKRSTIVWLTGKFNACIKLRKMTMFSLHQMMLMSS